MLWMDKGVDVEFLGLLELSNVSLFTGYDFPQDLLACALSWTEVSDELLVSHLAPRRECKGSSCGAA